MKATRRTQPYRKTGARPATTQLSAMKRGTDLFGKNLLANRGTPKKRRRKRGHLQRLVR